MAKAPPIPRCTPHPSLGEGELIGGIISGLPPLSRASLAPSSWSISPPDVVTARQFSSSPVSSVTTRRPFSVHRSTQADTGMGS